MKLGLEYVDPGLHDTLSLKLCLPCIKQLTVWHEGVNGTSGFFLNAPSGFATTQSKPRVIQNFSSAAMAF